MSRFLFVAPPLAGHLNPTAAIATELTALGHEVAWAGSEKSLRPLLGEAATVLPTGTRLLRPQADRGLASIKSLWERFIVPHTRFTLPGVDRAVRDWRPDVLVVDQHSPAGAIVAHRHGLPWVTLAPSSIELGEPLRRLPLVGRWIDEQLLDLWTGAGLPADEFTDPRCSPTLVLGLMPEQLAGSAPLPARTELVGPAFAPRASDPGFPWHRLDSGRRRVLVSMGTLADDLATGFLTNAVAALSTMDDRVQAVVVAPQEALHDCPPSVLVVPWVPMLELLPHVDVVVGHGGMNTVCETLAHGIPLVLAPIRHDQPINASRVADAGAGRRISFTRATAEVIREAVADVLDEPGYRAAAWRIRDTIAGSGGAARAACHLDQLTRNHTVRHASAAVPGTGSDT